MTALTNEKLKAAKGRIGTISKAAPGLMEGLSKVAKPSLIHI